MLHSLYSAVLVHRMHARMTTHPLNAKPRQPDLSRGSITCQRLAHGHGRLEPLQHGRGHGLEQIANTPADGGCPGAGRRTDDVRRKTRTAP